MPVPVPEATASAVAYTHTLEFLWAASQLAGLVLPGILLFTGWGARLRSACARLARNNRFFTLVLFAAVYLVLAALVVAPIHYVRDFVAGPLSGASGKSAASLSLADWIVGEIVPAFAQALAAALFLWIPYWLIRRFPRWWWAIGAAALVPVAFLVLVALPVVIDPLTAHYEPLKDKALATRIEELAARCGVHDIPVFVGGDDDTVVGLGPTKRIFLQEDIATAETPEQIVGTVSHELKHYVLGDNYKALAIIAGLMFSGFLLVQILGRCAIRRWQARFGIGDLADPASLPLIVLVLSAFWLLVLPAFNWEARSIEREADRFGLELTHTNHANAELYASWATTFPAEYDWFFYTFRATHPSLGDRIRFANTYRPWETGQPLVYADVCKPTGAMPTR
ncbi:MAG: M48 family metalloprotease [Alphaproteobacteria bacterium]|nr:M48 family metalloprotease [Alphaproteobacteria bacterium]MBL6940126.1 M48 family metalloprotease [Alphaproteobacteria bacterium]MBL7100213.1 M48 family metalloprotease [Alphaproteobacteria bacterium]